MKTGKYTQSELDFIKLHLADDPEKVAKVLDRSPASVKAAITRIKTSGPDPRQQELPLDDAPPTPEDAPPTPEDAPPTPEDAPPTPEDAPPPPEDAPPTNAEQVATALLELTNLQPWMAYQLAVVVPEELIPAHAVRLHESPTCQVTGAPFVEDTTSPYAMVYVPEEDVLISRAAFQVKGVMTVNMLIKFCRIVAKANPLTA